MSSPQADEPEDHALDARPRVEDEAASTSHGAAPPAAPAPPAPPPTELARDAEPAANLELAARALVTLRTRVAAHGDAAFARTPDAFACRPGCDACCHRRFSVFSIEAERVRGALRALAARAPALRERIRQQASDPSAADRCALLVDGRCSVYDERPMICRSHGLPLGWVAVADEPEQHDEHAEHGGDDDDGEASTLHVDVCALNFREHEIPIESVLRLEAVDAPLAVIAEMWDGGQRVELALLAAELDG